MKLTILTQYYPPEMGAPQSRLSELVERFAMRGHEITVLTAMPNYPTGRIYEGYGGLLKRERRNGAEILRTYIYPTQTPAFVRRLTSYFSFVLSSAILGAFLLDRCDYLLVESPPLFLGLAGFCLAKLKRARLVFNVSDLWPETAASMGILSKKSLAYRLSQRLEEFLYSKSWLITGQSREIVSNIIGRFPDLRVFHLSNGADAERFGPDKYSDAVREEMGAHDGDFLALYAGLHGLAQGLDQILDAAAILQTEGGFRFVFVGDGPDKRALVEHSANKGLQNVLFLEPRPAAAMPQLLAGADAMIVPLRSHIPGAVPSKIYEAMASQRPVVLAANGEAAQLILQNEAGITVEPGDSKGLSEALRKLRSDRDLCDKLGANGRRAVEEKFDRSLIASRFIAYLEKHKH